VSCKDDNDPDSTGYIPRLIERWVTFYADEEPVVFGVDWAKGSGFNRGDIIARPASNVIRVRFKTVEYGED